MFEEINNKNFDIVICVGPNDIDIIKKQIYYTLKNILNYRNIYIIVPEKFKNLQIENSIIISENIFPFSLETVSKYHGKLDRNGWYLQQLLKLYAGLIIPDILDIYLVIDADTFFLKPTIFYEDGRCLYNYGNEYHYMYFLHMQKLDKNLRKMDVNKSGICHHMMFQTKYIKELFDIIEKNHNDLFYNIFLEKVTDYNHSGASEYEIYFNFMLNKHPDKIKIRKLNWTNTNKLTEDTNYDYISYHWYMR